MHTRNFLRSTSFAVFAVVAASSARAHEREFTQSRDWFIPYPGEFEVESRNFFDTSHGLYTTQVEVECGITKHIAIEPGVEISETSPDHFDVTAFDAELRTNFGEFAYDKLLFAFNLEYENPVQSQDPNHLEGKFIVSRYSESGLDATLNLNVGRDIEIDNEWEEELTAGVVYPFFNGEALGKAGWRSVPRFGVEGVQNLKEHHTQVGPLFVYRAAKHLNFLASYMIGVDERDENSDVLTIIAEWEF